MRLRESSRATSQQFRLGCNVPLSALLVAALWLPGAAEARRIVSLAPSITETLFALGAERDLVGVSDFCDFPAAARSIDRVGSYLKPNVEAILAHRPDVVLAVPSPGNRTDVESLAALGLRVVVVAEGPALADVLHAMQRIGEEAGRAEEGARLAARVQAEIDRVRTRVAGRPRRRTLLVVGRSPLVAAGEPTLVDEMLRLAGAENVATGLGRWPRLSIEYLIRTAPEIVLDASMGSERGLDASFFGDLGLEAARAGRVHAVARDEVLRPGPRVGIGVEKLARVIHPEAFPAGAK